MFFNHCFFNITFKSFSRVLLYQQVHRARAPALAPIIFFLFFRWGLLFGNSGNFEILQVKNKAAVFYWFELNLETLLKYLLKHS